MKILLIHIKVSERILKELSMLMKISLINLKKMIMKLQLKLLKIDITIFFTEINQNPHLRIKQAGIKLKELHNF